LKAGFVKSKINTLKSKIRTGGSRPARRHPFCPGGNKKDAKNAFLLAEGNFFASFHRFLLFLVTKIRPSDYGPN